MSEIKVNKISPRTTCGTTQLGDAGDTITVTGDLKSNSIKSASGSTLTLGQSGDTVTLASGASQTGFGRTGTVDWQTGSIKTATFTAANGEGYFANTSGGAFNMNLPAGSAGAIVSVADYAGTFQTNNLTIVPNGSDKIGSTNNNATLDQEGQSATFVYVDSTQGWINTMDSTSNVRGQVPFIVASVSGAGNTLATAPDCSNMKIATFTGPGTFTVCAISSVCAARNKVDYMVVAGGGGGSGYTGAGGAGGFRESHASAVSGPYTASPLATPTSLTVTATGFPIVVGGGGATGGGLGNGVNGSNSSFSTITSAGGGYGGGYGTPPSSTGGSGGSGGGGGHCTCGGAPYGGPGGSGNTPSVSPPQGQGGGNGTNINSPYTSRGGGGGGGAGGSGSSGSSNTGGNGGAGVATSITGSSVTRAGGGGGSGDFRCGTGTVGTGGSGGGTNGAPNCTPASNATANTGGGGGAGALCTTGGIGGSGIVVIRYKFQ